MKKVTFSPSRIVVIARNTFLEAVRQKLFNFLVLIAIGLIVSSHFFREFNFGSSELKFIVDFGFGAIVFFGSILAIVATAQLFFSEIENRTALTILAKPVVRSEFIFGNFAGVAAVLLVFSALMTIVLAVVVFWRETTLMRAMADSFEGGRMVPYSGIFLFGLVQWLKFCILCAITMVIASFSNTNLYTVVVGFFVLIICHLQYLARDAWVDIGFAPARWFVYLLGLVFPNFQLFNVGDQVALGEALPGNLYGLIIPYALAYVAVFSCLAVYSFKQREI